MCFSLLALKRKAASTFFPEPDPSQPSTAHWCHKDEVMESQMVSQKSTSPDRLQWKWKATQSDCRGGSGYLSIRLTVGGRERGKKGFNSQSRSVAARARLTPPPPAVSVAASQRSTKHVSDIKKPFVGERKKVIWKNRPAISHLEGYGFDSCLGKKHAYEASFKLLKVLRAPTLFSGLLAA